MITLGTLLSDSFRRPTSGGADIRTTVLVTSFVELASTVVVTLSGYYILCIAIPRGDLSFRTPPVSVAALALNGFSMWLRDNAPNISRQEVTVQSQSAYRDTLLCE